MRRLILLISFLAIAGCTSPKQFVTATAQFSEAVPPAVGAYRSYILTIYTLDADTHLRLVALDPSRDVDPITLGEERSFSEDALISRLQAMDSLILYSQGLAAVAGADLGSDFRAKAIAAGAAFDSLQGTVNELRENDPTKVETIGGPVATIVGEIGASIIENMQADAIRTAILDAEPAVTELIEGMQADVATGGLLTIVAAADRLATAASAYNKQSGEPGFAGKAHERALNNLKTEYVAFRDQPLLERQVSDLLGSLAQVNRVLVKQAKAQTEENRLKALNEALAAIQKLTLRSKILLASVDQLRN